MKSTRNASPDRPEGALLLYMMPLDLLNASGPALASLFQSMSTNEEDFDGLIFGTWSSTSQHWSVLVTGFRHPSKTYAGLRT